ncbi:MAG: lipid II flippase MurJ, partial [Candidatus Omnitrophica bacterium]|nr:lipid II flippase MurJ [Candidatus Omnitrophota bacterium]
MRFLINFWKRSFPEDFYLNKLLRVSVSTTVWSTCAKALGFIIPLIVASKFGVNLKTDLFFFVYGVILYLASIVARSYENNIVPVISKIRSEDQNKISAFLDKLLMFSLVAASLAVLVLVIFAQPIFSLITRFPAGSMGYLLRLFAEISPFLVFLIMSSILNGLFNAYNQFWLPAISPGIRALVCITVIFLLGKKIGIHAVILGYVLGEAVVFFLFLFIAAKKNIYHPKIVFRLDKELRDFLKIISFQIVSMVAIGLNPVVDQTMASWLNIGSVSILQYAEKLYQIPVVFILSGFIVVILSRWSE